MAYSVSNNDNDINKKRLEEEALLFSLSKLNDDIKLMTKELLSLDKERKKQIKENENLIKENETLNLLNQKILKEKNEIGDFIIGTLRRTPSGAGDTYGGDMLLKQIAAHAEKDTLGSKQRYIK